MDFGLSEEARELVKAATDFAGRSAPQRDSAFAPSRQDWRQWGEAGWLGACLPEECGGAGHSALSTVLAFEALGRGGIARGWLFAVGAHLFGCSMAIANHGNADQRNDWCRALASGEAIGALAFTEPGGGSSLESCATRIDGDDDGFLLNGRKTYVTNGADADIFLVLARDSERPPPFDLSMILVPRKTAGLAIEPIIGAAGLRQSNAARLRFEDCRIAAGAILGSMGGGLGLLLDIMRWERSCILAGALGALERDLLAVTRHLSGGEEEDGATRFQAVAHDLARVRARIESARWLMYRAAWELDGANGSMIFPAMSKLTVSEALVDATLLLRRLIAGHGWAGGLGLTEALDDAVATLSASGTTQIQLNTIYSQLERDR